MIRHYVQRGPSMRMLMPRRSLFQTGRQGERRPLTAIYSLALLFVLAGWAPTAFAATIFVTSTADNLTGGDGLCTLREAIRNANTDTDTTSGDCAAGTGTDTIVLSAGLTYTLALAGPGEDAGLTGDLDITDPDGLTIATDLTFGTATINGNALDRVIEMRDGPLTLNDLIIENGRVTINFPAVQAGAGIAALDGDLTLTRVVVRNNTATGETNGIGVAARYGSTGGAGTITISESTISGNTPVSPSAEFGDGGGLFVSGSGTTLTVINSTISSNVAPDFGNGAGVALDNRVTATFENTTIAGNSVSGGLGGGLYIGLSTVSLRFSTIAGNDSDSGGGIFIDVLGTVDLSTSILADNTASMAPNCFGSIGSTTGYNLVEDTTDCTLGGTMTGNVTGVSMTTGMLSDNGGLTETKTPPSQASNIVPAVTGGCGTTFMADQRGLGFTRAQGAGCESGAFEEGVTTHMLTVSGTGDSNGIVTGFGVTCQSTAGVESGDCTQTYADETSVTVTATAMTGALMGSFTGFTGTGSAVGCSTSPCTFTINATSTIEARFATTPLPVELVSFQAFSEPGGAVLRWETASELDNAGFEVQHQEGDEWNTLGFVEGAGTTLESRRYRFDAGRKTLGYALKPGRHRFRLKQIDLDGTFAYSTVVETTIGVVHQYYLSEVYPNPFNPQAQFSFAVAVEAPVRVMLYDALGRFVTLLYEGIPGANQRQRLTIDGAHLHSGVYLIRLEGNGFVGTRLVTLLK